MAKKIIRRMYLRLKQTDDGDDDDDEDDNDDDEYCFCTGEL